VRAVVGLVVGASVVACSRTPPTRMPVDDAPSSAGSMSPASDAAPKATSPSVVGASDSSDVGPVSNVAECASPFAPYFPPNDGAATKIDPKTMLANGDWWKEYVFRSIRTSSEPPLWNCGKQAGPDTVRVFDPWGGLEYSMVTRIERTDEHIVIHIANPHRGMEKTSALAVGTWHTIAECLERTHFWEARSHAVSMGLDGNHPIMEAVVGGRYNAVMHGSFSQPPRPACFECLDLVEKVAATVRKGNAR